MKKLIYILFLLPFFAIGQVSNGTEYTEESFRATNNQTVTTSDFITTTGTDGTQGKILGENISLSVIPPVTHFTPVTSNIKGYFQGVDNALGDIVATTAGVTTRLWLTADQTTITAGTFYRTNFVNKGVVASAIQSVTNNDDEKKYFTQDIIGDAYVAITTFPKGVYAGNLSVSTSPNSARQKFTVEVYKCNNAGTPIASGISGAVTGSLGVTVITILDSGELTLADGSVTNVPVSNTIEFPFTINVGERVRYHISAEKVGTTGANITESLYLGTSYNSYIDVPVPLNTSAVQNISNIDGDTTTDALNNLDAAMVHKTGSLSESITGAKTITNSVYVRTNYFDFINNFNSGSNNRTVDNSPLSIQNNFGGIGFHFDNQSTGWGGYGFNQSSGILIGLDATTSSTGDLLRFSKNEVTTAGIKHDGSLYTTYGKFGTSTNVTAPQVTVTNGSNPSVIEFPKTGFTMVGTVGALGSYEMNMSTNMDYTTSPGTHRFYDNTKDATWLAIGDSFWQMQYAPASVAAGDVWNIAGQPRPLYQRTDTGLMRVNTTVALSGVGTIGDAMFAVRRSTNFASISGEDDLVIEGAKTKGVSSPIYLNAYNTGNVFAVSGGGNFGVGTTSPVGKMNVVTGITGSTIGMTTQPLGSFSFGNGGSVTAVPTMIGKSNDGTGIQLQSGTNDVNAGSDILFSVRENDNTDYTTLTTSAFRFSRFSTTLMDMLRNGNTTFTGNVTAANLISARYTPTFTAGTNVSAGSVVSAMYNRIGNMVTVKALISSTHTVGSTASNYTITLPINRATSTSLGFGFGSVNVSQSAVTSGVGVASSATTTATVAFTTTLTGTVTTWVDFSYLTTD